MAIVQVQLSFSGALNISAQVGDNIYFTSHVNSIGGFSSSDLTATTLLGPITLINNSTITVQYDDEPFINGGFTPLNTGDFISFAKDKSVNTSSLLGYYASVNFVNDSTGKIELFSVGSDISESSK
jgi:hypothetical protein